MCASLHVSSDQWLPGLVNHMQPNAGSSKYDHPLIYRTSYAKIIIGYIFFNQKPDKI